MLKRPSVNTKKCKSTPTQKRPPIEKGRWAAKGNKPLPEQATIKQILIILIIHTCRKVLFIQTEVKITLYSIALFFGSLVCDFLPIPPIYLASQDNIIYLYFVRLAWFWAMITVSTFIYMTSITYGCGRKEIVKRHLARPIIGTVVWYLWTQVIFVRLEAFTGVCLGRGIIQEKLHCVINGFQWHSFDVSAPAFLLVYINLLLVEEAKAIIGWEGIKDLIRVEEFQRVTAPEHAEELPLGRLSLLELFTLKQNYEYWTPYIRAVFFLMTMLSLMCDVMIACVVMYFHTMPTKVAGGAVAIATWYFTYRFWFKRFKAPGLPGAGIFSYQEVERKLCLHHRRSSLTNHRRSSLTKEKKLPPTFMGMPLNVPKENNDDIDNESGN